jgi:integrase/recombinase XerD
MRQGSIPTSPLELLQRPRVAITSGQRYLNLEELRRLLLAAKRVSPTIHALVLLLAGTGLRVSEAATAQWRHLFQDPDARLGLLVTGKGGKQRVVKISDRVLSVLAQLHGSDRLDARDRTPLIQNRDHTAYSTRALWAMVKRAGAVAGIDKPISPHWLRHTAGTLAAKGGADVFTIQQAMGHSRLETSMIYIHLAKGLEQGLSDYIPDLEKRGRGRPRKQGS